MHFLNLIGEYAIFDFINLYYAETQTSVVYNVFMNIFHLHY